MDVVLCDLNQRFPGKPDPRTFAQQVAQMDVASYTGRHVQLRGCAPTWAHLMVAAKLREVAAAIEFRIDDGKGGIVVPIWSSHAASV